MPYQPNISLQDSLALTEAYSHQWIGVYNVSNVACVDSLKTMSPDEVFGSNTQLLLQPNISRSTFATPENLLQPASVVLLIICILCYGLYRYTAPLRAVMKNTISIEMTLGLMDTPSREFTSFIRFSNFLLSISFAATFAAVLIDVAEPLQNYYSVAFLVAFVVISIALGFQRLLNKISAIFSENHAVFENITSINRFDTALFAYLYSPVALVVSLTNSAWMWIVGLLLVFAIFHVFRIFNYLHKEKFYFLQWFLYLCGVEMLPLLMLVAVFAILTR